MPDSIAAGDDFSDCLLEHIPIDRAFNFGTLRKGAHNRESALVGSRNLGHEPIDHLLQANLLRYVHDFPEVESEPRAPTIAALLLFGSEEQIRTVLPAAQTVVTCETASTILSMSSTRWLNIVESVGEYVALVRRELQQFDYPVPVEVITELLVNAYLHRCYRTSGPVRIRIRKEEVEIQNPGGLLGGLTADNLLNSTPFYKKSSPCRRSQTVWLLRQSGPGNQESVSLFDSEWI